MGKLFTVEPRATLRYGDIVCFERIKATDGADREALHWLLKHWLLPRPTVDELFCLSVADVVTYGTVIRNRVEVLLKQSAVPAAEAPAAAPGPAPAIGASGQPQVM